MKNIMIYGLMTLILLISVSAYTVDQQTINMKTTDFFILQFEVNNINDIDLRNCVPYFDTSDTALKSYVTFNPEIFDLRGVGAKQVVSVKLDKVPVGYYTTTVNVKCERYDPYGELVDIADILAYGYIPKYEILVSPAGEGQNYVFVPLQSYDFLARPGETKTATFTIANTGEADLEVEILPEVAYQKIITVEPRTTTIPSGERTPFKITVQVPQNYTGMNTSLNIVVGDYKETFPIRGTEQELTIGGPAVSQNLLQGTISAGNIKIPIWLLVLVIIIAGYFLLKPKKKGKK